MSATTRQIEPTPTPRLPAVARVILVPLCMLLASLSPALLSLVPGMRSGLEGLGSTGATLVGLLVLAMPSVVGVLLLWFLSRGVDRRSIASSGWVFDARTVPLLLLGTALAVAAVLVGGVTVSALGWARVDPDTAAVGSAPLWVVLAVGLTRAFLMQGLPEELLFRGYLMATLRHRPLLALWVSTLVFTAMHLISQGGQQNALERVLYLALPFGMGFSAAALVLLTGSVWTAVGIHGGVHTGILIGGFLGVGTGPAVWVGEGALLCVVALVALARWNRAGRPAIGLMAGAEQRGDQRN